MELVHNAPEDLQEEVELLLAHCLKIPFSELRVKLRTQADQSISQESLEKFYFSLEKRCKKYPIAYITEEQAFWSLNLFVNECVLIPRPETECLVEFILDYFGCEKKIKGHDLGTGSGAIILALAHERPDWQLSASELSQKALDCAKHNAQKHHTNIHFFQSDWFKGFDEQDFDFIVSNPPYIETSAAELLTESILFEPQEALSSGDDGLKAIREICSQATAFLKTGAPLILEHGFQQARQVEAIFLQNGFNQVKCYQDYAQLDRFTVGFHTGKKADG